MQTADQPTGRSIGGACIRAVYLGIFSLGWVLLGVRRGNVAETDKLRLSIDETLRGGGDPEITAHFTAVGAQMPTVVGLVISLPTLLLYPLYEAPAVLTLVLIFMMSCTAFALTQTFRHMVAVRDRTRWRSAGRPQDWKSSTLAHPSGVDIIIWFVLTALLAWAVG